MAGVEGLGFCDSGIRCNGKGAELFGGSRFAIRSKLSGLWFLRFSCERLGTSEGLIKKFRTRDKARFSPDPC